MDEARIRSIVQEELRKQNTNSRFSLNPVQRHTHNGLDSPKINSGNILPGLSTVGTVRMEHDKTYRFNVNFLPTSVRVFGEVVDSFSAPTQRTLIIGEAAFGQNLYFQPDTTSSVKVGGKFEIVQASAMFSYYNAGPAAHVFAQAEALIFVTDNGTDPVARADVVAYGQNFFVIQTSYLEDNGKKIGANFFVS